LLITFFGNIKVKETGRVIKIHYLGTSINNYPIDFLFFIKKANCMEPGKTSE